MIKKRIYVFVKHGMDTFINPVIDYLRSYYDVQTFRSGNHQEFWNTVNKADLCWFEWADDWVVSATAGEKSTFKYLVRMHSYEAFTPIVQQINWNQVDALIVPNVSVMDVINSNKVYAIEEQKAIAQSRGQKINVRPDMIPPNFIPERVNIVPNPVDGNRFKFVEKKDEKKIAMIGQMNFKKDPMRALDLFLEILNYDKDFTLHLAGDWVEPRYRIKYEHIIQEKKLQNKVVFYKVPEEYLADWLKDKNYILSTSVYESFHYSIANGMCAGLIPLVGGWPGCENLYPKEYIYYSISDAIEIIKRVENSNMIERGRECRKWVMNKFKKEDIMLQFKKLVDRLLWSDYFATSINSGQELSDVWSEVGLQHLDKDDIFSYCKSMGMING